MKEEEVILTISGKEKAVEEIVRHIDNVVNLCKCGVEVRSQSTLNLKEENKAIHKQCYIEQKKITVLYRLIRKNNVDLYNKIVSMKDEDFEKAYSKSVDEKLC